MSLVVAMRLSSFVLATGFNERVVAIGVFDFVLARRIFSALMMREMSGNDEVATDASSVRMKRLAILAVAVTVAVTVLLISKTKEIVALLVTVADTVLRVKVVPTAGPCP
jgi:hypothetical protein